MVIYIRALQCNQSLFLFPFCLSLYFSVCDNFCRKTSNKMVLQTDADKTGKTIYVMFSRYWCEEEFIIIIETERERKKMCCLDGSCPSTSIYCSVNKTDQWNVVLESKAISFVDHRNGVGRSFVQVHKSEISVTNNLWDIMNAGKISVI